MESDAGKCVMDAPPDVQDVEDVTDDAMVLDAQQILTAQDLGVVLVDVPEWGGQVFVRMVNGQERDEFEARQLHQNQHVDAEEDSEDAYVQRLANFRARLAALTISDKNGKPLFTADQAEALGEKNAAALCRVYNVACELNGFTQADVGELVKNSGSDRSADSGSASA